jgi:UDP-N-acetylmuramyl pentapeptide phosphotransferase/UDP-N-acetylglucosamine-1-phosphate transferase
MQGLVITIAFISSMVAAMLIIPKILVIANKHRLYDSHDDRKIHIGAVPRIGGISFVPCVLFAVMLSYGVFYLLIDNVDYKGAYPDNVQFNLFFCGLIFLFLGGIKDDLIGLRYIYKFAIQIGASLLILFSGTYINNLYGFMGIYSLPACIGMPLTVLAIVFITNAINLIDGMDGLASGLSIFALSVYGVMFLRQGLWTLATLSFATIGVLLPFFYYNVFGKVSHKTKLFMGDSGSLTLGFILAYLSVRYISITPESPHFASHSFVLALSPLFVPLLDVMRVFLIRLVNGNSPFKPDRNHIHHKLQNLGLSNSKSLIFILLFNVLMFFLNFTLLQVTNSTIIFLIDVIIWLSVNMWLSHAIVNVGSPMFRMSESFKAEKSADELNTIPSRSRELSLTGT